MEEKILGILTVMSSDITAMKADMVIVKRDIADLKAGQEDIWDVLRGMVEEVVTRREFYAQINPLKQALAAV